MLAPVAQDQKKTQYEFELISGNMKAVHYQKEEIDGYSHFYHYDELNRLKEVETTTDNDVHRSTEARYQYYDYCLSRCIFSMLLKDEKAVGK